MAVNSNLAADQVDTKQGSIARALPVLGDVITNLEKLKPLGRLAQGVAESLLAETLKSGYTIVFDDLERSCLPIKDLLGVLNRYIEDLQLRVIIISNESKLKGFSKYKEKLIGQSIEVMPQVSEAYDAFVSELKTQEVKEFGVTQKERVISTFKDSGCSSLRILRHILKDLSRLRNVLTCKHLANSTAINELVSMFCARDIEIRAGNIDEGDLQEKARNPYADLFEDQDDNKRSPIMKSESKFAHVNFASDLLNVDVMTDMLIRGRFIEEEIRESIDASRHFQTPEELPPWRVLMQFDTLEDLAVERAIERIRQQLRCHKATEFGEILHIFSLMMMMSQHNVIDETITDLLTVAESYIDHLVEHGTLVSVDEQTIRVERHKESYAGYQYHVTDAFTDQFKRLRDHLIAGSRKVYEAQWPVFAERLVRMMSEDVEQFLEQICRTNSEQENTFASIPILKQIDPGQFVGAWLMSPVENWRTISIALDIRYEDSVRRKVLADEQGPLADEHEWGLRVYERLLYEAGQASKISALRLRRCIPKALQVLAGDAEVSELRR